MEHINNTTNVGFKAIQLNSKEACRVGRAVQQYRLTSNQTIKEQILDIFIPHIEKEAGLVAQKQERLSISDYKQKLYLKLFECIENIKCKKYPAGDLVRDLNEVSPDTDDFFTMGHKSFDDLTIEEEFSLSEKVDSSLKEKMGEVFSKKLRYGSPRSREIALEYLKGASLDEIGFNMKLTAERVRQVLSDEASYINIVNKKGEYFITADPIKGIEIHHVNKGYVDKIMESESY